LGRKVHPIGFRIGVIRDWQAKWYGGKYYLQFLQEDLKLRKAIRSKYADASISLVEIDRQANKVLVTIHTSRPGVVIGRGGQRVDETRQYLEDLVGSKVQLNIQEIRQPELDAYLVARSVADQIERRIAFRRAMKRAVFRTLEAGAKGMRITCSGRLGGTEIARREMRHQGQVPLHKLRADIDYGFTEACTTLGRIGVKVWIYRGDILPQAEVRVEEALAEPAVSEVKVEEKPAEPAAEVGVEVEPSPPTEIAEEKPEPEPVEPAPVELEKKPAKRVRKAKKVGAVEAKEPASVELEKKPVKRARKAKKVEVVEAKEPAPVELEKKPVKRAVRKKKAEAEEPVVVESEKKPAKPARKVKKAKAEEPAAAELEEKPKKRAVRKKKAEAEEPASIKPEEKDATT